MRTLIGLGLIFVTLIPTWVFLLAKNLLDPQGFWQNFFLLGFGVWLLGGLQIFLGVVWLGVCIAMFVNWADSGAKRRPFIH